MKYSNTNGNKLEKEKKKVERKRMHFFVDPKLSQITPKIQNLIYQW